MFSNWLKTTRSWYLNNYELLIGILASILVFRKPGTIAIILFIVSHLLIARSFKFSKNSFWKIGLIALPFLLDVLFLWNNVELSEGFKHMEKRMSMLLFPVVLIGSPIKINFKKVLTYYSILFTCLLVVLLIRFLIIEPELVSKYLKGIHLWEMGYSFANSTGVHAPALNMHVAFLVVVNTYLAIRYLIESSWKILNYRTLLFLISVFLLLIINTRLAVANAFIGIFLVLFLELFKKVSRKKLVTVTASTLAVLILMVFAFAKAFPYITKKYTTVTFAHMDKVGKLDDFENPEGEVFNSFVTRVSIWKTAWERAQKDIWIGVGAADGKDELNQAYLDTNQQFLAKYKFPTHNQYLDFLLKFGLLGLLAVLLYVLNILWLGWRLQHSVVLFFFVLFFTSNLTDDFLIRYDGITFSALWISIFSALFIKNDCSTSQSIEKSS